MDPLTYEIFAGPSPAPLTTDILFKNFMEITMVVVVLVIILIYFIPTLDYMESNSAALSARVNGGSLRELTDIMQQFHTDPNKADYERVARASQALISIKGRHVKFWLWGVYMAHPDYPNEMTKQAIREWVPEIERALRRIRVEPTTELIMCLWYVYFATGDQQYAEVIRRMIGTHPHVGTYARRTYERIMKRPHNEPIRGTGADYGAAV